MLILGVSDAKDCRIPGECETGFFLGSEVQETYRDCLNDCKTTENCNWFTHFASAKQCKYYRDCPTLDTTECSDCYTGEATCPDAMCSLPGFCQGASVGDTKANSEEHCQKDCFDTGNCTWYSFYPDFSDCILHSECEPQESSSSVYGERDCYSHPDNNDTDPGIQKLKHF